ncbi:hypothetical protein IKF92_02865 [Candidatus Saccharibacteria bacterium]|nr:hypothetical protein [Candidatus Saccharibacteria bacterium]
MEKETCRKAEEISSIGELRLSRAAERYIDGMSPEELILSVRNYEIYSYDYSNGFSKLEIDYLIDEIESVVRSAGFLRDDLKNTPEAHFVERYVFGLGLMKDRFDLCVPFYESNEAYEGYVFSSKRLNKILSLLEEKLTEKQFLAVKSDIYDNVPKRSETLKEAKKKLQEKRDEICDELCEIFA